MNKEKMEKLTKYLTLLENRLTSPVNSKHKDHPESLRAFLNREIKVVKGQIAEAKLESQAGK